jgi:hypothetical protein
VAAAGGMERHRLRHATPWPSQLVAIPRGSHELRRAPPVGVASRAGAIEDPPEDEDDCAYEPMEAELTQEEAICRTMLARTLSCSVVCRASSSLTHSSH